MSNILQILKLFIIFLPFILVQYLNERANFKKEMRHKQFVMPVVSLICFVIMFCFMSKFYELSVYFGDYINQAQSEYSAFALLNIINDFFAGLGVYMALVIFNIALLSIYIFIKRLVLAFFRSDFDENGISGLIAGIFYEYDKAEDRWYLKKSCGQMRSYIKIAYKIIYIVSVVALFYSYELFTKGLLEAPFTPILVIIVIGELSFFIDGLMKEEGKSTLSMSDDYSKRIAMYALLRKPLKKLFGDKLASEGTTINITGGSGGASEDVLENISKTGGHIGSNYAAFMRKKIDGGLNPNVDYVRSGYDLAIGKSLLFNTPFYDKLIPYAFYAVNRSLLKGHKVLVVMGRHGTEDDLIKWCQKGVASVTNVPGLYKISVLSGVASDEDDMPDIGIISRSGVHDLEIHKANIAFLKKVGFIIIVEPSRLVTTAQIGLNLLIKCCGEENEITFCSMDRNCDGLVDSLSHILMTNITEVSATEYPHGMSSFMCWKADDEYLQHRMFPGVSRYLGLGTELSFVALKNQVKQAVWYGGDAYPVVDAHWISKQYYYDFLKYANLPTTQECFDQYFKTSFNMCNECVSDYSYVTVEDDRNNLFEARRNFATIAENQGFVNVISSEYMLREYMADNTAIFTADAKAIPYITADYARTKRNYVLSLCLLLCVGMVSEKELKRKLLLMGIESDNCADALWKEMCNLFSSADEDKVDKAGNRVLIIDYVDNESKLEFEKDTTVIFKREYSVESGKFENVYTIENKKLADIILDDLQNAGYIAELEGKDYYIGTELKGHVYQKYLPGQFFTLNGKYYEMISTTADNKIMVRRASEHINGRISYRQVRKYILDNIRNSEDMGTLKTVNNIGIHYLYTDIGVQTDGYWKLKKYNDFENGSLVEINAVPMRKYFNKQVLKLDFSNYGEMFTESVRKTLTVLLNEVFVTLFAENQPFISAVTVGERELPLTYGLEITEENADYSKSIFIIEDSQLDIGLLVAVERNLDRIMQIISDYLSWNQQKIEGREEEPIIVIEPEQDESESSPTEQTTEKSNKKNPIDKIGGWFKSVFKKSKKKSDQEETTETSDEKDAKAETDNITEADEKVKSDEKVETDEKTETDEKSESDEKVESDEIVEKDEKSDKKNSTGKVGGWFKSIFKKSKKKPSADETTDQPEQGENQPTDAETEVEQQGVDSQNEESDQQIENQDADNQTEQTEDKQDSAESERESEVVYSE